MIQSVWRARRRRRGQSREKRGMIHNGVIATEDFDPRVIVELFNVKADVAGHVVVLLEERLASTQVHRVESMLLCGT